MNRVKPWTEREKQALHLIAKVAFTQHTHEDECDELSKINCSACRLVNSDLDSPNVAGWERMYIEARKPIPEKWKEAFQRALFDTSNTLYLSTLRRSIATFGYPKFTKK